MLSRKVLKTAEEIKAFTDPYRTEILINFQEIGEPATVKQVADRMGEVPAKVHYHVKKLEKVGIVNLIRTKEINGIVAKYYEPVADTFEIESKSWIHTSSHSYKSELEKVIHLNFERSKKILLGELRNIDMKNADKKNRTTAEKLDATLGSMTLNLSEGESKELINILQKYSKKTKEIKGNNSQNKKKYHFFYAMTEVDEEK